MLLFSKQLSIFCTYFISSWWLPFILLYHSLITFHDNSHFLPWNHLTCFLTQPYTWKYACLNILDCVLLFKWKSVVLPLLCCNPDCFSEGHRFLKPRVNSVYVVFTVVSVSQQKWKVLVYLESLGKTAT